MNRKGEVSIGSILMVFVAIIVAIALLIASAQNLSVTSAVRTYNTTTGDDTVTLAANGARIDLLGQELISTPVLHNASDNSGLVINVANYTVGEHVSTSTGVKSIFIQTDAAQFASTAVNITYTYGGEGFVTDGGARSVIGLIIIFAALAIAVVTLSPTLRNGIMDFVGRMK